MSSNRNTVARTLHDVGLAAWFGGSLMGAIGVNGAAADVSDPRHRARVANAGWARWTPVGAVAIGAHLLGGAQLLNANKKRVATQAGTQSNTVAKLAVTGAALGATAYSRVLGQKILAAGDVPVAGGTDPLPSTPPEVAKAQKQLKALQWVIPALTGVMIFQTAQQGEQQKPAEIAKGVAKKAAQRARKGGAAAGGSALGQLTNYGSDAYEAASNKISDAASAAQQRLQNVSV